MHASGIWMASSMARASSSTSSSGEPAHELLRLDERAVGDLRPIDVAPGSALDRLGSPSTWVAMNSPFSLVEAMKSCVPLAERLLLILGQLLQNSGIDLRRSRPSRCPPGPRAPGRVPRPVVVAGTVGHDIECRAPRPGNLSRVPGHHLGMKHVPRSIRTVETRTDGVVRGLALRLQSVDGQVRQPVVIRLHRSESGRTCAHLNGPARMKAVAGRRGPRVPTCRCRRSTCRRPRRRGRRSRRPAHRSPACSSRDPRASPFYGPRPEHPVLLQPQVGVATWATVVMQPRSVLSARRELHPCRTA